MRRLLVAGAAVAAASTAALAQTFQLIATPGSSQATSRLLTADIDGDSFPDLISSNSGAIGLYSWRNPGGTPALALALDVGAHKSISLADLDLDGATDLIQSGSGIDSISRRLSLHDGTFGPKQTWLVGTKPNHSAIADFDGDGWADLATGCGDLAPSGLSLLHSSGPALFDPQYELTPGGEERWVASGDLDSDGVADVVSCTGYQQLHFYPNPGALGPGRRIAVPGWPTAPNWSIPAIADLDGDGDADLFARSTLLLGFGATQSSLGVLLFENGVPAGAWQRSGLAAVATIPAVALGDVDADGNLDAVSDRNNAAELQLSRGRGDGTFDPPLAVSLPAQGGWPVVLDWNGDGKLDLASATGAYFAVGNMCWLIQQ